MPITSTKSKTTKSTNSASGRYVQGGSTEQYQNRIGWWERRTFERSSDDITITVTPRTAGRPDLIAFDIYEKANLQWFVLQYNNIVDINTEITPGTRLLLPTPARMQSTVMTQSTGGTKVN